MAENYRQSIDGQEARPPRYSFLVAAPEARDGLPEREWALHGVRWRSEHPAVQDRSGGFYPLETGQSSSIAAPSGTTGAPPIQDVRPFGVYAQEQFNAAGEPDPDMFDTLRDRAIRQLEATRSHYIALELMGGALTVASPDSSNHYLAEAGFATTVTTAPTLPPGALAAAEYAYMAEAKGQRGMVHVTTDILMGLVVDYAVRREGNLWLTPMDNIVVADSGYDGRAPGAGAGRVNGSTYLYVSPMIRWRLSAIDVAGTSHEAMEGSDRSVNAMRVLVKQLVLLEWDVDDEDGSAPVFAAQTDVDVSP